MSASDENAIEAATAVAGMTTVSAIATTTVITTVTTIVMNAADVAMMRTITTTFVVRGTGSATVRRCWNPPGD